MISNDTQSSGAGVQVLEKGPMKGRIQARYDRHMPNKRHHRILVWAIFLISAAIIAAQLLYPPDRALPFARVGSQKVAWYTHEQLAETISAQFQETSLQLIVDGQITSEVPLASLGAEPNTEKMIERAVHYSFWQRFVPFSIFVQSSAVDVADVYYTTSILKDVSEEQASLLSIAPVNARLAIEDGALVATDAKRGSDVTPGAVYAAIVQSNPTIGDVSPVIIPAIRSNPKESTESLQMVREAAEEALGRHIVVKAGSRSFIPDNVTIASWLKIGTNEAGESILELDSERINAYFDTIDKEVGKPAGRTNISLTDGQETSREAGESGKAIDREPLITQITQWLLRGEGQSEFVVDLKEVPAVVVYDHTYSATEAGLRAYLEDAARRMDVRVAILQLDGGKWSASVRADDSIPSASTYKLFVAKWLFDQMDKGIVHWDDSMLDVNVSTCFDRMIIASTNPCAESWLAQAGRPQFNEYIYSLGFSQGTNFAHPVATHTTANDLQRMMIGINNGSLMSGANRDRLLHSLTIHPYRYGIPAGSSGQVADKVGFLWDYVHDTAIVKHPKGTYIMTIMTKGQSYATIASLTREIEQIMYP